MKTLGVFRWTVTFIAVVVVVSARAEEARKPKVHRKPKLETGTMGGVDNPTKDQLLRMHKSQYIFHARGGDLPPRMVPLLKLG